MTNNYPIRLARPLEFDESGMCRTGSVVWQMFSKENGETAILLNPRFSMDDDSYAEGDWGSGFCPTREKAIDAANDENERLFRESAKPEVIEIVEDWIYPQTITAAHRQELLNSINGERK